MKKSLEIYVHIPFCVRKCKYCDFLSFTVDAQMQQQYISALQEEIKCTPVDEGYQVTSVYIGGGTPSAIPGEWIAQIMETLKQKFCFAVGAEISIEANPGTVDEQKLLCYRDSGINRLSLGLQSTDQAQLEMLGRIHSLQDFEESYRLARQVGFTNINVDLMSGLPAQTLASWMTTLDKVAAFKPEHISAYSLIIEEGTAFATADLALPDEETERLMYERTREMLKNYGYQQYEISNYARKGCECQHNIGYWERTEYLGFGLGAASLKDNVRYSNTNEMKTYLDQCCCPEKIRQDVERLTVNAQIEEFMFLGLRLVAGISRQRFAETFARSLDSVYGQKIAKLVEQGLMMQTERGVKLTARGMDLSNYVFVQFLLDD